MNIVIMHISVSAVTHSLNTFRQYYSPPIVTVAKG